MHSGGLFVFFNVIVICLLVADLGIFNRRAHTISSREALIWTLFYIIVALLFGGAIALYHSPADAVLYLTGYIIEKTLSVDNIFVFLIIFSYFNVPSQYQHRVLFWGIIGALIFRAALIMLGISLIAQFHWLVYVLGLFLIFTGVRAAMQREEVVDIEKNPLLRTMQRVLPLAPEYHDGRFIIRQNGRLLFTPLFVVLVMVETTDLIFALDSIPAILAISQDPFIVYTSNVFAILGLRALYFVVADLMRKFKYLKLGVSVVLVFVGAKMLLSGVVKIPPILALFIIIFILLCSTLPSLSRVSAKEKI